MGAPCPSTCGPWASTADVCSPCDDYAFPQNILEDCLQIASDLLFEMSGQRFPGSCQDVVRPLGRFSERGSHPSLSRSEIAGYGLGHGWFGLPVSSCSCQRSDDYGCGTLSEITLGGYPITQIFYVKVDGQTLDPSLYRVDDYRYLVRLRDEDGSKAGWPCCQSLDLAATEPGTFEVSFAYGFPVPPAGVRAAADLGCQLAISCSPETLGNCSLPPRVTQVSRQGVTVNAEDLKEFLREGRTGILSIDLFLQAYNPNGLLRAPRVISPDIGPRVRRTNT